jgi:hypothetical protein
MTIQPCFAVLYCMPGRELNTMISEKQLEASRRNAERSTGARSDAGKSRSSLNNLWDRDNRLREAKLNNSTSEWRLVLNGHHKILLAGNSSQ